MVTLQKLNLQAEIQKTFHHHSCNRLVEVIRTLSSKELLDMFECCCADEDMEKAVEYRNALLKLGAVEMELSGGRSGKKERSRLIAVLHTYRKLLSRRLVKDTDTANSSLMWLFVHGFLTLKGE